MNEPNGILASTNARLAALEEKGAERVKEVAALKDENRRLADALADSEGQLAASQARVAELEQYRELHIEAARTLHRKFDDAREEASQANARVSECEKLFDSILALLEQHRAVRVSTSEVAHG